MPRLFDSHAHYTDARFSEEVPGGADALLASLFDGEVGHIVNVGSNEANSRAAVAQAARFEGMYAAVGLHPEDIGEHPEEQLSEIEKMLACARENKIVALGEIGFDYHYEPHDPRAQAEVFEAQLYLAQKYDLPVIIHDREAHGDCLDMIRRFPDVRGVFHSFSGSPEMALELCRRGWYISFSGVLTFKNARKTPEAAVAVPSERILIETDCPYLAPTPHRGELNHSGLMRCTAMRLSELRGMEFSDIVALTEANAAALFGLDIV